MLEKSGCRLEETTHPSFVQDPVLGLKFSLEMDQVT